ncbi:MAG TPA: hypothetical protein VJR06_02915 [Nitrososphaerales archaeon]|nr:hypothetical protein [Nitrososphaerales archaeon]
MSRQPIRISAITRITFLVLLGLIALGFPIILFVFVPVLGWFIWRDQDRISQLEKRLAALEKPSQPKSAET